MLALNQHPEIVIPRTPLDSSLALWAPLYELDGASFASKDAYGHLCTRQGSLWTPQGDSLDGTDDYLLGDKAADDAAGGLTLEVVCRFDKLGAYQQLVSRNAHGGAANDKYTLRLSNTNVFEFQVASGIVYPANYTILLSTSTRTTGIWYHVCAVFDPQQGKISIYVNGNLDCSMLTTFTSLNNGTGVPSLKIGAGGTDAGPIQFIQGMISDVMKYNVALHNTKIMQDHLNARSRMPWF